MFETVGETLRPNSKRLISYARYRRRYRFGLGGRRVYAWRLLSEGPVVVWNRTAAKCDPFGKAGARVASTPGELVAAVDIVIIVTSTCHDVGAILQDCSASLAGKDLISLVTASPAQARALGALARKYDAAFLSGAIRCYPSNIGSAEAIMLYGSDHGVWERRQTLIRRLAGSSVLVGEDDGRPNVLDSSVTGCFLFSATAACLEAANYAIKDGLELSEFRAFIETALQYLPDEVRKVLDAVQAGEYRSAEATIETYAQSLELFRSGFADVGAPDHLLRANLQRMRTAIRAGDGGQGFAALYRHNRSKSPPQALAVLRPREVAARHDFRRLGHPILVPK